MRGALKKAVFALIAVSLAASCTEAASGNPLAAARMGSKWGFIGATGKWVLQPRYDYASSFSEGLAFVAKSTWCGYIDASGKVVLEPRLPYRAELSGGGSTIASKEGNPWFRFNDHGYLVPMTDYARFSDFHGGIASVLRTSYLYDYYDTTGRVVVSRQGSEAAYSLGMSPAKLGEKYGYVDPFGKPILAAVFEEAKPFSGGFAWVKADGEWTFIDKTGRMVVPPQYDDADSHEFAEGLAAVAKGGKWGFVDTAGRTVVPLRYEYAYRFSDGLAPVKSGGSWGFVDKQGRFAIPPKFGSYRLFHDGMSLVKVGDKIGYLDKTGKMAIAAQFGDGSDFSCGLAAVKKGDKWGYVDTMGRMVVEPALDEARSFSNDTLTSSVAAPVKAAPPQGVTAGSVSGKLTGKDSGKALSRVPILLSRVVDPTVAEPVCQLDSRLVAETDIAGSFAFTAVPAGDYVLVFGLRRGGGPVDYQALDKLQFHYAWPIITVNPSNGDTVYIDVFGGNKGIGSTSESISIRTMTGTYLSKEATYVYAAEGYIFSEEHGLGLQYTGGAAQSVWANPGEETTVELSIPGL